MTASVLERILGWRPRIRTVLVLVNLVILCMPLVGIQALNLYESELIQRTESALIAQGTMVREQFLAELLRGLAEAKIGDLDEADYGMPVLPQFRAKAQAQNGRYRPIFSELSMHDTPPLLNAAEAEPPVDPPDEIARRAAKTIEPMIKRAQLFNLSGVRLVDFRGVVVGSTGAEKGLSLIGREEVRRALTGETVKLLRRRVPDDPDPSLATISRGTRVRVFVALPVVHEDRVLGAVILSRTPLDLAKALYNNRHILMRYTIVLILIVLIVSILTATTISRPVQALIDQTNKVKEDPKKATVPIRKPGSHELLLLSQSIAEMARTLRERAQYIEDFARNVSHEFKTPLASIQGTVELLKDHLGTMTTEEKDRFLGMLEADANRMEQLVERLLELARADVLQPGDELVDAAAEIRAICNRYRDRSSKISTSLPEGAVRIRMARSNFQSIVTNLLDNAIVHGGNDVPIQVALEAIGDEAVLMVADEGPGISEANRRKVFDAFFTTARERGGTGLGLSIVKSLVEGHGGRVRLAPSAKGTRIEVALPARLQDG